jgi:hypothetical protein
LIPKIFLYKKQTRTAKAPRPICIRLTTAFHESVTTVQITNSGISMDSISPKPRLRDQFHAVIRINHYSRGSDIRTVQTLLR